VDVRDLVSKSWVSRPGPVFIEVCLDVSAMDIDPEKLLAGGSFSLAGSEFVVES
jgi:hypothetical protein